MTVHKQASETAQALARLVPTLRDDTLAQLHQSLAHSVASRAAAEQREANLGLVLSMLSSGTGEIPSPGDYKRARAARMETGESWPTIEQLSAHYGHWTRVVRAGMALTRDSGHARLKVTPCKQHPSRSYRREEIIFALRRFHRWNGAWPTPWEYLEWAQLERRNARRHGHPNPRLPGMKQIAGQFGTFDAAVRASAVWTP